MEKSLCLFVRCSSGESQQQQPIAAVSIRLALILNNAFYRAFVKNECNAFMQIGEGTQLSWANFFLNFMQKRPHWKQFAHTKNKKLL